MVATSGKILVAYATKRGSTREVAEGVARALVDADVEAELRAAAEVRRLDGYRAVVLGGALYTGRWHADARRFLARHRKELARMPVAIFAMGPRTMEAEAVAESRAQLDRALRKAPEVEPVAVAIFGGVVDPAKLPFPLNRMPASDARDWVAIRAWARSLPEALLGKAVSRAEGCSGAVQARGAALRGVPTG